MTETIMPIEALHEVLPELITTKKVRVKKIDDIVQLEPVKEKKASARELLGLLADCPEMSVDKFLERKHADKELEL